MYLAMTGFELYNNQIGSLIKVKKGLYKRVYLCWWIVEDATYPRKQIEGVYTVSFIVCFVWKIPEVETSFVGEGLSCMINWSNVLWTTLTEASYDNNF